MRKLSDSEKRTIRLAAIGLGVYLALFVVYKCFAWLEGNRVEYAALCLDADSLNIRLMKETRKQHRLGKLRRRWNLAYDRLGENTVVGDARVAIENTARACGIGLGFAKESPGRARAYELAVYQVSGSGKASSVAKFFDQMGRLGYPVVLDNISLKAAGRPGAVSFSFSAALIDYQRWTSGEARRA